MAETYGPKWNDSGTVPTTGEGYYFLTGNKKFKGYLDRLRENLQVPDESIANARSVER